MEGVSGGSTVGNELLVKYNTIATEYSKARVQLNILKKAVVDEQNRNTELNEVVRQLKQSGRKAEQEIDSLTFRNQQLTCRVTVLQDELEELQQNRGKKNKGKPLDGHHNSDITNHVIDEEFRKKIAENAELLSMMHEKEESHLQEVASLTDQLERLQRLLEQTQKANAESEEKYKAIIAKLEREKLTLREGSEGLENVAEELSQLQRLHNQYKTETEARLVEATAIISSHLPFIDSSNVELSSLNIPRFSESKRPSLPEKAVQQVWMELGDTTSALAELHQYSDVRLNSLPQNQSRSSLNKKYSLLLKECGDLAMELEKGLREVASGIGEDGTDSKTALNKIPNLLASYCTHIETLMPLLRISLEDEDGQSMDEEVRLCTQDVVARTSQFVSHIVQLNSVVTLASKQKSFQKPSQCMHQRHEQELIDIFNSVHEDTKEMFGAYVSKFSKECDRTDLSEELKLANSNITTALSKLMDSTAKVVSDLKQLWQTSQSTPKKLHPAIPDLSKRAAHYFNCLETEESPSVPYLEALKDLEEARNGLELRQGLKKQLSEAQSDIVKLDQECEHWKHEYQMVKSKLPQVDIGNKLMESSDEIVSEKEKITNMLGSLDAPFSLNAEISKREEKVKKYFLERINYLISEKQEAQSKAACVSTECSAIKRRLESCLEQARRGDITTQELREKVIHLQEELATTATSYEAQLSTMSDHLATMNERLAAQRETIDHLQYQISNKSSRKMKK
ncbi:protein phosphatase 1 regulatory subunit 21 [Lycorma delicatula]|uniref:protein phosphatase 1 regulatory subunit 21 n=1 Tax=Lycorma delicatula TaxID=130591 RepID=UPI003F518EAB